MDLHMYSVVHRTVKGTKESPIDFKAMQEQQRRAVALENSMKVQKELEEKRIAKNKQMAIEHASFAQNTSKFVRNAALNKMYGDIAEECLGEAFSYIYLNSLPHDKHFIKENSVPLIKMGCFYMKKLGGIKYLKQRVMETHNPFLKGLYNAVEETAKDIYKKRSKQVANTISDEEAMNIIKGKVDDKSRNEMLAKIDSLGADELSELVKNKVIAVVKRMSVISVQNLRMISMIQSYLHLLQNLVVKLVISILVIVWTMLIASTIQLRQIIRNLLRNQRLLLRRFRLHLIKIKIKRRKTMTLMKINQLV